MRPTGTAISARDLLPFRTSASDYELTERLKADLAELRATREPFFLTAQELEPIFRWKLGRQYGRNRHQRAQNSDPEYRSITCAAFAITRSQVTEEAARRLKVLTCLDGVGVPVASAMLALVEPSRYCVTDLHGWRAMYLLHQTGFSIGDYLHYLMDVTLFSAQLGWSVQETDLALWAYDEHMSRAAGP